MAINLTDTSDPHHSLLRKPEGENEEEFALDGTETENDVKEEESFLPKNPPIVKDSVYWWGRNKKDKFMN